ARRLGAIAGGVRNQAQPGLLRIDPQAGLEAGQGIPEAQIRPHASGADLESRRFHGEGIGGKGQGPTQNRIGKAYADVAEREFALHVAVKQDARYGESGGKNSRGREHEAPQDPAPGSSHDSSSGRATA